MAPMATLAMSLAHALTGIAILLSIAGLAHANAAQAACVAATESADWLHSKKLLTAPVQPADCAIIEQTPPQFGWPDQAPGARYRLTLFFPDGQSRSRETSRNWLAWPEPLASGQYAWRVTLIRNAASAEEAGSVRRFTVSTEARPVVVPDARELYRRAATLEHPRALPRGAEKEGLIGALLNERRVGVKTLLGSVDARLRRQLPPDPPLHLSRGSIESRTHDEMRILLKAAFAWVVTRNDKHLADAKRRALNVAAWDARGATSFGNADRAGREIAWTLALVYDWLYEALEPAERQALRDAIRSRANEMLAHLTGPRGTNVVPLDSHGNHSIGKLAVIAVLLAGDVPEAESWLHESLPLHLHLISPWGGEDGGYANGTGYALWDAGDSFVDWHILRWATGVDVSQKAWVRNFGRFLVYFLPPGTPRHTFGDGAEETPGENWARFGKAYALLTPSALSRWYAAQLFGEDPGRLEVLLAPRDAGGEAIFPEGIANAALFPSIGWSAMHSDLRDRGRVSVYFKSSSYGSHNHSHADQNSFVINARGQALAVDSGYYDAYHSPHWENWTKQTRAHNTITFDGGQGQTHHTIAAKGKITQFETDGQVDVVTGDAAEAYGGALRKAVRSVVYNRPDQIIVFDRLESDAPRRWEWNLHALERMVQDEAGRVLLRSGSVSLCVTVQATAPLRFEQSDAFTDAPRGENRPNQWHGRFETVGKTKSATFAAVLSVDCRNGASVQLDRENSAAVTAMLGGAEVRFDGTRVVVARQAAPAIAAKEDAK